MNIHIKTLIISIVVIFNLFPLYSKSSGNINNLAKDNDSTTITHAYFFTLAFGYLFEDITTPRSFDYNFMMKFNYRNQSNVVSILYSRNEELGLLLDNNETSLSNLFAINYGRILISYNRLSIVPSIGLSYDIGKIRREYHPAGGTFNVLNGYWEMKKYNSIGIYSEIDLKYRINNYIEFGLAPFANINKTTKIFGIKGFMNIGKIN